MRTMKPQLERIARCTSRRRCSSRTALIFLRPRDFRFTTREVWRPACATCRSTSQPRSTPTTRSSWRGWKRCANLLDVLGLVWGEGVDREELREPKDRIQGRSQFVAHLRKEVALRAVRAQRFQPRQLDLVVGVLLGWDVERHAAPAARHTSRVVNRKSRGRKNMSAVRLEQRLLEVHRAILSNCGFIVRMDDRSEEHTS